MTTPTLAEQTAGFIVESYKDGLASDGSPTAEELAATAANKPQASGEDEGGEDDANENDEGGEDEGGESQENGGEGDQAAAGQGEGDGKQPPADDKGKPKAGKKSSGERIGELTANWRTAQREADSYRDRAERAERELAAAKSGKAPLTPQADTATGGEGAPDPSQFDYGELDPKYIVALTRYTASQERAAEKAKDEKDRQDQAAAARQQELGKKQSDLVKAGVKLHDDFDEVVIQGAREGKWELSQHLGPLLLDSEFGAQIAYDLAKDPDEAARVGKLSPTDQAKWLGRQEAKFEAAKPSPGKTPPKAPQAPPPPKTPRGNSGSNKVGADSSDFASVEAAWRGGQFK